MRLTEISVIEKRKPRPVGARMFMPRNVVTFQKSGALTVYDVRLI